jgi:hypothetical protein
VTEICLTPDEWRLVVARRYPDAQPSEIISRADGAMFYGLRPDLSGQIYRAAFFPAYSYGYVEVPR